MDASAEGFLPARLYRDPALLEWERAAYLPSFWHPVACAGDLPPGHSQALQWLDQPILLSRSPDGLLSAFANACPHRGVALLADGPARACRKWVCPYHGWTFTTDGRLRAAAREGEFHEPFERSRWNLIPLPFRELAGLIWIRLRPAPEGGSSVGEEPDGPSAIDLEAQLDLVLEEAGGLLETPRSGFRCLNRPLRSDWKLAHDNTLDDYHVAIAHPRTLHPLQGPVSGYRHGFGRQSNLLATPWTGPSDQATLAGEFLTFGVPPCHHLLFWPDGRLAAISFVPDGPGQCRMALRLLGPEALRDTADAWLAEMERFLDEDTALVESAQRGFEAGVEPGPAHRLEARILHHHRLYRQAAAGRLSSSGCTPRYTASR
ncbi:aromatic ring-hydroxylating dioxygenase subunit alpha [Synechococcus sp. RSCCF101]|uniref:aromatic ring-hydroxylating oxygenase subunit alpha n=1 Tax=Synechococcus sp. RSCCF101 TaxID=2511069 RepID=UPI00124879DD|nr:aromatic ring-hydroxylating dioxygenase subunit alpha [Synechococcus sp. RSCCF101]QEY31916.1 aromatic ring-hydroxylating dioxygenase subunit alpha [Synechococcus sp. RSCCF101]